MRGFLCCAVVSAIVVVAAGAPAPAAVSVGQRDAALEQGILRDVNHLRVAHGLAALQPSAALGSAATFQSKALLAQGLFDHSTPGSGSFTSRLRRFYPTARASSWSVGENLLWSSAGISPAQAVELWLQSPEHRRIMLDPSWREFGIGAVYAPAASGVYAAANGPVVVVTVDFGARLGRARTVAGR